MSPLPERMADHWWWRPGCRPGRGQYVWHVLFDDQPEVREAVRHVQNRMAGLAGFDLPPEPWLHMTTHIVGFADEISRTEASDLVAAASRELAGLAPVQVRFSRIIFHPEAVVLAAQPASSLTPIRQAVCDATRQVLGSDRADGDDDWIPHVTAAYSNAEGPAQPVIDAVGKTVSACATTVGTVDLVIQERHGHSYRWKKVAAARLDVDGHASR
jgi:hypothetical protein